jgi:Ala-tRNA(Pro) deacylase
MSHTDVQLDDGSPAATSDELFRRFDELKIAHETVHHDPVFTVEEAKVLRGELDGAHTKNLFLRNKKGAMWLVVCLEDRLIDLKALARHLGAGRFSFSSADLLARYLGVIPGAVTPFAVINDKQRAVQVVVDLGMLNFEQVNFHPLDNTMTSTIHADDLLKFLRAENHAPEVTDLGAFKHDV